MFKKVKINAKVKNIGKNVKFGKNVTITGFKGEPLECLTIGNNCVFHDNVRIRVSPECHIGDDNVFHDGVSLVGSDCMQIGHGNWVGEKTFLDSTGKLTIENHNVIGLHCMIWSHLIRPQVTCNSNFPGCPSNQQAHVMNSKAHTIIKNFCWLMGGNIQISPGVVLNNQSIILANSVVTGDTEATPVISKTNNFGNAYGGVPAKPVNIKKWK